MSQNPLEGPLFSHRSHLGIFLFFKECADWVSQSLWLHRAESHRKHTAADERVALSAQIHARLWCAQAVWVKPHQAFSMLTYMRKSADWVQPLTYLLMRNWVKRDNSLCRWRSALPCIYSLLKAHIECNYGHLAMPAVFNSSPCPPPYIFCMSLSLLTHLFQIISSLEVRSVHELCSDWHAPYTLSIGTAGLCHPEGVCITTDGWKRLYDIPLVLKDSDCPNSLFVTRDKLCIEQPISLF